MAGPQKISAPGARGGTFEKPTGRAKPLLLRLWRYLARDKWLLALAAVLSISANLLALVGPKRWSAERLWAKPIKMCATWA